MTSETFLSVGHPSAAAFIDESGSVSNDRFFVLGCMKTWAAAELARKVRLYRDRAHFYQEIHFARMTAATRRHHMGMVDLLVAALAEGTLSFSSCIVDREDFDVVAYCGGAYNAYEAVATRLLIDAVDGAELISVIADDYSSPKGVTFEENVQVAVNSTLGRLVIPSLIRMDSRASDLLQLADLLTSLVGFDYRADAGLASKVSPKGRFVAEARKRLGCPTFVNASASGFRVRGFPAPFLDRG
ncbi:DUF3800 domain-containing protein [Actinoallomurus sp. CA-150999]|uniref:DUF3800 domain-containing protein n=1 Tax=Actinoallomurus sp. CA-150999 TaxID=3239887 RepID=UPI003D89E502